MQTPDLFARSRKCRRLAEVFINQQSIGLVAGDTDITPTMRAHGITMTDLKPVLAGRTRARTFRCNGMVRIVAVEAVPSLATILAA